MTREDIIRMAQEAGFCHDINNGIYLCAPMHIERFAALVAAAEREKVAAWMIQRGYATGHGDTTEDLLGELDWQVLANWSIAMKTGAENEREACAYRAGIALLGADRGLANRVDQAIRAKGQT